MRTGNQYTEMSSHKRKKHKILATVSHIGQILDVEQLRHGESTKQNKIGNPVRGNEETTKLAIYAIIHAQLANRSQQTRWTVVRDKMSRNQAVKKAQAKCERKYGR